MPTLRLITCLALLLSVGSAFAQTEKLESIRKFVNPHGLPTEEQLQAKFDLAVTWLQKEEAIEKQFTEQAIEYLKLVAYHDPQLAAGAVPLVIKELDRHLSPHHNIRERCELLRLLGTIGLPAADAAPSVARFVDQPGEKYTQFETIHAAAALARIKPAEGERMAQLLIAKLDHSEPDVRWIVADALGDTGMSTDEICAALARSLDDSHVSVRAMSARALLKLEEQPSAKVIEVVKATLTDEAAAAYTKPPYLSEPRPTSRHVAMSATVLLDRKLDSLPEELKQGLLSNLGGEDDYNRLLAIRSLAMLRHPDAEVTAALKQVAENKEQPGLALEALLGLRLVAEREVGAGR